MPLLLRVLSITLLALSLAACAITEAPAGTPPPPVTLAPVPEMVLQGDCSVTPGLDSWLQATELYVVEFQALVNAAPNKQRGELYEDVLRMARIRDVTSQTAAPECVVPVHFMLMDTLNNTVDQFQAYVNGDVSDLGDTIPTTLSQIDRIIAGHNELKARLEAQYRSQIESN